MNPDIISALQEETYLGEFTIRGVEVVGPKVGGDLQWQAIKATLFALGAMLIYIAFRFEWVYGVAAVIAVSIAARLARASVSDSFGSRLAASTAA